MQKQILVVEPEKNLRQRCREELEAEGYRVFTATDSNSAVARLRNHRVNVVVFGLAQAPGTGMEDLTQLALHHPDLKLVIQSSDPASAMDFRTWVAEACLPKSADLSMLKQAVNALLCSN